ncbi:glycoside hydrolase family 76 protein [Goodfellowiella coeruleoviolacea]|uniref:Glycosyl hydrolase family 76 n=1 Tax=Goodfellowiella coeruleoviolacea TaxID=334858 RepID=A0AAE3GF63_9PSEU|nr:glycoside hydrolase family 76 protein [Goodfellowiella coeruleoviolacea]MCP2165028.1 Glycosyl hydrolase family 76 [Goodfellowiella coeruleoviolacea]
MPHTAVLASLVLSLLPITPPEPTAPPHPTTPAAVCVDGYCDTRDPALPPSARHSPTRPDTSAQPGQQPPTARAAVCNTHCDARDPALSSGERVAQTVSVGGRQVSLRFDNTETMGWGVISGGGAGDAVWLDRSFDAGASWASGSKLGETRVPSGHGGWRTLMYNVDDWANLGVGLLRACGQPSGSATIACTSWYRTTWNAWDRRTAAATALMQRYNLGTGLFDTTGWWNSANALTAIIDNIRVSGMGSYRYTIARTYERNRDAWDGDFVNEYNDDTAWWGLAWIAAYDLTGERRYLDTARVDAEHMAGYWDAVCGGGVWWTSSRTYKNAITNALYIQLNAALHNRIPGDTAFLDRARAGWAWFQNSGMINSANLVNDGLTTDTCRNNNQTAWSYNQGVPLAALVELSRATGDPALLDRARTLANASTSDSTLNPGGILFDNGGGGDVPSFKGGYVRGLAALNRVLPDHPYTGYLTRQADSAHTRDRSSADSYDQPWAGPFQRSDAARQHSAVDLMNATG